MSIEVTKIVVRGFEEAVRGMRNSWDSWEDSDSDFTADVIFRNNGDKKIPYAVSIPVLGEKDLTLMRRLNKGGSSHSKYRRVITASMDINAPLLWWKQMDTYSVGVVPLSCSTMHTITKRKFTKEDFAADHLGKLDTTNVFGFTSSLDTEIFMDSIIEYINSLREGYIYYKEKGDGEIAKKFWRAIIDILPSCYMQKRTWFGNYEVLAKIYAERKGHKLDEWDKFREVIRTLPYAEELIIGG